MKLYTLCEFIALSSIFLFISITPALVEFIL